MSGKRADELCREAAQIITDKGLAKGHFRVSNGACCAEGAVRVAAVGNAQERSYRSPSVRLAVDALNRAVRPHGYMHITTWNDAPLRTADEVVALLRAVADDLAERAS